MTPAEIITTVLSIISLVVAIISWSISHHVNKKILAIEERRERDRHEAENTGKVKVVLADKQFLISNEGPIDIVITEVFLNGIEIRKHPCFKELHLGTVKLPSGQGFYSLPFYCNLSTEPQYLPPFDVLVKWETKKGDKQQQEMTVNWI